VPSAVTINKGRDMYPIINAPADLHTPRPMN
jgi:hypothetical protein